MLEAGIDEAKRMANKITTITLATGVFLGCAVIETPVVNSAPTLLGSTPYLSFNDSPFKNFKAIISDNLTKLIKTK